MILRFWFVAISFFLIDQITKLLTINFIKLPLGEYNTPLIENKAWIFPMYNENNILGFIELPISSEIYKIIYLFLACIVVYGCLWVVKNLNKTNFKKITFFMSWAMGLIAGAFLGNSIDRFFHYGVIDFIQIINLPVVFNLADVFALIGAVISLTIATYIFSNYKKFKEISFCNY